MASAGRTAAISLGSAKVQIERDRTAHRVPAILLHLIHDLALELWCRPLTGGAFAGGFEDATDSAGCSMSTSMRHELYG